MGKENKKLNAVLDQEPKTIQLLRDRLFLLTGKDRVLMTMYLEDGHNFRQISQLTGYSETSIARRIRILSSRLLNCEYITCLKNRSKFTATEMNIAKHYFLLGLPMKKIAVQMQLSYYSVRNTIKRINNILNNLTHNTTRNLKQWQHTSSQKVLTGN
jgi:predicted DNA-binding protein YlxM (UPF0122 family)